MDLGRILQHQGGYSKYDVWNKARTRPGMCLSIDMCELIESHVTASPLNSCP